MHFYGPPDSEASHWETPKTGPLTTKETISLPELRQKYKLKLDPCAAGAHNSCTKRFYTPEDDGLKQPWDDNFIMNPPGYSEDKIIEWLEKAVQEVRKHKVLGIGLLPSYTGAEWFQDYVLGGFSKAWFLIGRIKFWEYGVPSNKTPNFYSVLVFWKF